MSKLIDAVNEMITGTYMNIKGQGRSLTLVQGHSDSILLYIFFLETAWPIAAIFYVEPTWGGGMPIYGKIL